MSDGFVKLFSSILDSTLWQQDSDTRIVWITMLAMADPHGELYASIPGVARRAGVSLEACQRALHIFQQVDEYSRTPDNNGRRIEPIDGGWEILNYERYRFRRSSEHVRETARLRQQRRRERLRVTRDSVTERDVTRDVTKCHDIAEAEAEAERSKTSLSEPQSGSDSGDGARKKTAKPPSQEAVRLAALLKSEILLNKCDYRITLQQERKWAETADRILRLDGRTEEQMAVLIRWAQHDEFWRTVVLSMDKLREKFDALEMKRNGAAAPKTCGKGNGQAQLDLSKLTPVEPMPTPNQAVIAMTGYKPNGGVKP